MDASTESRIAKNTRALTTHVLPNSRPNETRLRVSSSRNAAPSRKKCGLNRRIDRPTHASGPATRDEREHEHERRGRR